MDQQQEQNSVDCSLHYPRCLGRVDRLNVFSGLHDLAQQFEDCCRCERDGVSRIRLLPSLIPGELGNVSPTSP